MRLEAEGKESLKLVGSMLKGKLEYPVTLEVFLEQAGENGEPKRVVVQIECEGEKAVMSDVLDSLYSNETFHVGRIVLISVDKPSVTNVESRLRMKRAEFFAGLMKTTDRTPKDLAEEIGISMRTFLRMRGGYRIMPRYLDSIIKAFGLKEEDELAQTLRRWQKR